MGSIRNITAENFEALSKTFMDLNDGTCFELSVEPWIKNGNEKPATLKQWLAWRDYRKSKGMRFAFMDTRGMNKKTWAVPTEWPHEFDAERSVQDDHAASRNVFENPFRDNKNKLEKNYNAPPYQINFQPFPQLWAAFGVSEPELLMERGFGVLQAACIALATGKKDKARSILTVNTERM